MTAATRAFNGKKLHDTQFDHRYHRPGRIVSRRVPPEQARLRSTRAGPRSSSLNRQRIDHLFARDPSVNERIHLHYADLADASSLSMVMEQVRPDEVYNLGAQSHVRVSFDQPLYTADVVGLGSLRLLEAVRHLNDRSR